MNRFYWEIIECLINVFEMYIIYLFLSSFFERKVHQVYVVMVIIGQALIITALNNLFGIAGIQTILIMTLLWCAWSCLLFGIRNAFRYLYTMLICDIILIVTDLIIIIAFEVVLKIGMNELTEQNVVRVIFVILSKFTAFYIVKNISILKLNMGIRKRIEVVIFSLVLLINVVLSFIILDIYIREYFNNDKYSPNIMLVTLIICIGNVLLINIFSRMSRYIEQEMSDYLKLQYYLQQKEFMTEVNQFILITKQKQHDYNNHLSSVYALLSNEKYEHAKKYLCEQIEDVKETTMTIGHNSSAIEVIIYHKISQAKALNIEVSERINVPEDLSINEKDITVLIGNAMDNAIEACRKLEHTKKYIVIDCNYKDGYFNICIENSSNGHYLNKNGNMLTTKATKLEHGLGIRNINYIVEKNNGFIDLQPQKDKFILRCSILTSF